MEQKLTGPVALLSSAWKLFKGNWKILVAIAIVPSLGSDIGQLIIYTRQPIAVIFGALISIASAIFSIAMVPSFVSALHRMTTEPGTVLRVKGQYRIGLTFFWSVLLIGIINGLVFFGSFFVLVIPAIIIGIYASQYIFALVIDGKKGFSALTESYSLVKGKWWAVFGRAAFLGLIVLVVWLVIAGLGFLLGLIFGIHLPISSAATDSLGGRIIAIVLNLIGTAVIGPLALSYTYNLYLSLKATRLASVQTGTFKKWLVAFICVGVLAIIGTFVSVTAWGVASFIKAYKTVPPVSSTTPYTDSDSSGMIQGARPGGAGPGPNQ